jgi:signal recognition particle subunit SRP54
MFETLSDKLQRVFKNLRGEGKLTPENMEQALKEIRVALLEADVHFRVVKRYPPCPRPSRSSRLSTRSW